MAILRTLALIGTFGVATGVSAATFNVNNFNDLNDANPGNGVCDVGDGSCSLRAAAQEANALAGPDTILLAAGTHNLTQTYSCGGPTCGLYVEVRPGVEILGEGVGTTFIQGAAISYQGPVFQLNAHVSDVGNTRFADISINPGTFTGFDGQFANQLVGVTNFNCASCVVDLERLELNIHRTSSSGGGSPLVLSGLGPAEVRDVTVTVTGGGTFTPAAIYAQGGVQLLVEDFVVNGNNAAGIGVSYTAFVGPGGGPNTLTIRRSRFLNMSSSGYATIVLANINVAAQIQAQIEDVEVAGGGPGVFVRHYGTGSQTTHLNIERSLFTGMSTQALRLAGPCIATMSNSTISGAGTGIQLIAAESGGTGTCDVDLDSVTIAGGTTSVAVGSGLGAVSARNSILADAATAACTGTLDSLGHNLFEDSCTVAGDTTGNITGVDPMLDALADNGGLTRTRALMAGSPAIDAGDAANCPARDQRDYSRPADGDGNMDARCDIGAFEKDAVAPPSNDVPDALDDAASVAEDDSVTIAVSANDSDPDGNLDPSTANILCGSCSTPAHGALLNNGDGSFDYTPDADYSGADGFTYEICDSEGLCDGATVTISVTPVNDAPLAGDDSAMLDEDHGLIVGAASLLVNDLDVEGGSLLISDAGGSTGQGGNYHCDASSCSYNPAADFFGSDSFDYEVCDDGMPALCDTATVTVTVNAVNDAPSFLPGPAQVFAGGSSGAQSAAGWASSIGLGANEPGQSVQSFELTLLSDPDGVVSGLPSIDAAGELAFTLSGTPGEASFEVRLRDDGGTANGGVDLSAPALLSIAVGTAADVAVSIQQCTDQAAPGETYAYAVRIDNAGPDAALDVVLDAQLPAGASVHSLGNGDCIDAGTSVNCHVAQLASGDGVAIPLVLLMPGGGPATLDLSATVTMATDDPAAANDNAAASVLLVPGLILDAGFESCDGLAD